MSNIVKQSDFETAIKSVQEATSIAAPERLATGLATLIEWQNAIEETAKQVKAMVVAIVKERGNQTTSTGSKELIAAGWKLRIQPWRTGYDSKKVEALLRAKGLQPASHMDSKITYSVNEMKLGALVATGTLTQEELETTRYEETYTVRSPEPVNNEG